MGYGVGFLTRICSCFQGVVTAATSLITTLAQKSPDDFKTSVCLAVARLSRVGTALTVSDIVCSGSDWISPSGSLSFPQIVTSASLDLQDYTYYFVAAPWLSVKLLRLLQCYPPPGTVQSSRPYGTNRSPLKLFVARVDMDANVCHEKSANNVVMLQRTQRCGVV